MVHYPDTPAPVRPPEASGSKAAPAVHICHILFRLDVGGLENGVVNLINHMPYESCRHSIISLKPATDFKLRIRRPDVSIYEAHKRDGKDWRAYGRVFSMLKRIRPNVVHTRNLPALDMLVPAAAAGVRRLIHSEHGLELVEFGGSNAKYNFLRRLSRLLVEHYVCVSPDLAMWMQHKVGVPQHRISVICNGVDTERFAPGPRNTALLPADFAPPGAFVIGTIGRLEAVKDQVSLVRAFLNVLEARPDLRQRLRLMIIGDGRLRAEIEGMLAAAGASALAWLPGMRSDTPELYRLMDIFVLPSLGEGISNTLLEAMASGVPTVATRVGGNRGLVVEGETGLLVPPADPDVLAAALLSYARDSVRALAHGRAGRARALREFSMDAMVRSYAQIYGTR